MIQWSWNEREGGREGGIERDEQEHYCQCQMSATATVRARTWILTEMKSIN